ncbi:MAG TPA: HIT domain-containing protein [bacterium]|nr:HIT domain-containing protein [bacterium]HNS48783.1 HIT domain-containing protein [bacterium]
MSRKPDPNEVIWSPWRKGYVIKPDKEAVCVFCRAAREVKHDRRNLVLTRSGAGFVIINRFPYNNGHLMVVPNRHLSDLTELAADEAADLFELARRAVLVLKERLRPEGFNLGLNLGRAAGAGIASHLHIHIVPRWNGDTNFMPVVGGVKTVPDSLDALYRELRKDFQADVHR